MWKSLRFPAIAMLLVGLLTALHAGDAQPPKQDPTKADPKKNDASDLPDGLRVSLATHLPEIRKKLADKSPAERRTAMPLLAEVKREESGKLLVDLALFDTDTEIRTEAFRQLCLFPDLEGKVATQIALIFRKEMNPWVKQIEANFMTRLPFKHASLTELVRYIVAMKDPDNTVWDDQYDSQGGKLGGGGGYRGSKTGRDHFTLIVQALNAISGRNFPANRETGTQLAEWWKINEYDYQKVDQELTLKNHKEGIVGLNLVPGGTSKTSALDANAAKNEQAAKAERAEQIEKGKKLLKGILGDDDEEPAAKPAAKSNTKPAEKKPTKPLTENDIE